MNPLLQIIGAISLLTIVILTYMKLSELSNNIAELKTELVKVFGEQQSRYDALLAKYELLVSQLEDTEVPADAQASLNELKTLLEDMDNSIPDTEPPVDPPVDPDAVAGSDKVRRTN